MRGRKIEMGDSSCILFTLHKKTCAEYGNNSPTVECNCIKQVQFRDGNRKTTSEWKWPRAEDKAKQLLAERLGLVEVPTQKAEGYSVERAIDEWIKEREQDSINNVKAKALAKKLLDWCRRNNILHLRQIQKQDLRVWRTDEWKYAHGKFYQHENSLEYFAKVFCLERGRAGDIETEEGIPDPELNQVESPKLGRKDRQIIELSKALDKLKDEIESRDNQIARLLKGAEAKHQFLQEALSIR